MKISQWAKYIFLKVQEYIGSTIVIKAGTDRDWKNRYCKPEIFVNKSDMGREPRPAVDNPRSCETKKKDGENDTKFLHKLQGKGARIHNVRAWIGYLIIIDDFNQGRIAWNARPAGGLLAQSIGMGILRKGIRTPLRAGPTDK